jgi:hypothetical protein
MAVYFLVLFYRANKKMLDELSINTYSIMKYMCTYKTIIAFLYCIDKIDIYGCFIFV